MELDIYWTTLIILLPTVVLLTGRTILIRPLQSLHTRLSRGKREEAKTDGKGSHDAGTTYEDNADPRSGSEESPSKQEKATRFRHTFLRIYLLVMSSEWLSGPYLYAFLHDDKALPESIVVALYATTYTSAAISALVTGFLADRYGRRKACLAQCVIHSLACLTVVFGGLCLPVLFLGRVLAGTALTLLWTVFESWMVTEWNTRGLEGEWSNGGWGLSKMFGVMTTANCMTAIVGGIMGHCMVSVMGSKTWPFAAGIIFEGVAAVLILRDWNENYGIKKESHEDDNCYAGPGANTGSSGILGDGRIWVLTFVTCCFEGTNFIVIFLWPSVLQDAHDESYTPGSEAEDIPYGVIFATFMAAMILGALLFNASSTSKVPQKTESAAKPPVLLLMGAVMMAGLSLLLLAVLKGEIAQFCAFLIFQAANGVYIPSMAYIRGLVVDEKSRAGMYGLMKIPLFLFVILALSITAEGDRFRHFVFFSASVCLMIAALVMVVGFLETTSRSREVAYVVQLSEGASCADSKEEGEHGSFVGQDEEDMDREHIVT